MKRLPGKRTNKLTPDDGEWQMRPKFLYITLLAFLVSACVTEQTRLVGKGGLSWFKVEQVISGDTIKVNGVGRVKYIGISAPRRSITGKNDEPFWKESLEKNRELVEGKWVRFEMDTKRADSVGNILAYIFVRVSELEEIFVNGEMLRLGMGRFEVSTVNTKYDRRLKALEKRARGNVRGVWSN
jgi:micrococcal nuclease